MKLTDRMIFDRSPQYFRLPKNQFPISPNALKTEQDPTHILDLEDITVRMFEKHLGQADRSDVFTGHTELRR